jgi:tRNA threonylcarbamoyladenosine biosynthesis protein TsaB
VTILALDTTSEFASLAVRRESETVVDITLQSTDGFAHLIFPAIERVLNEAAVRFAEIDCFAAASGPGSFTGVRVGLSAVKGLASAAGKPAAGISNLRTLALFGKKLMRAAVIDARRGEIYTAVYGAGLQPVLPETVSTLSKWLKKIENIDYEFVSQNADLFRDTGLAFTLAPKTLASAIALCAELDGPTAWEDPALLDANYVRRSDAELFWQDPQPRPT